MNSMSAISLSCDLRQSALTRRSARAEPWQVTYDRDIGPDDLVLLANVMRISPDPKAALAKIKDSHHTLAQLLAQGKSPVEVSAITGYSPGRIYTLQADPAFKELLVHYTEVHVAATADIQGQVRHLALAAKQVLMDRLEDEPETFSNKDLKDILTAGLDRTGHGPTSNHNINLNDPTRIIDKLKDALAEEGRGRVLPRAVIDAQFEEATDVTAEASPGSTRGDTYDARAIQRQAEAEGEGGGGSSLPAKGAPGTDENGQPGDTAQ